MRGCKTWVAAVAGAAISSGAIAAGGATVSLEPVHRFVYAGDEVRLRLRASNTEKSGTRNPIGRKPAAEIELRTADGTSPARRGEPDEARDRPQRLAPGQSWTFELDLAPLFPVLTGPGTYEVRWTGGGGAASARLSVLPRFDPDRDYAARIDTEAGTIVVRLFAREAPIAIKVLHDLAQAGFYDGLGFADARPGEFVTVEAPLSDPQRPAVLFPTEFPTRRIVPGTVVMRPLGPSPPTNGPAFTIVLSAQPAWRGQLTVVGQVAEGLDIARRIAELSAAGGTGRASRPPRILGVRVEPRRP